MMSKMFKMMIVAMAMLAMMVVSAEAAPKAEVIRLERMSETMVKQNNGCQTYRTDAKMVDNGNMEVTVVEKVFSYEGKDSGVWIGDKKVAGGKPQMIGEHHLKIIAKDGRIVKVYSWKVESNGRISSMKDKYPVIEWTNGEG